MEAQGAPEEAEKPVDDAVIAALVNNKRRFLGFLERRVGDKDVAEEILQAAYAKTVEKASDIHDDEKGVAWFYRLLRNAIIDRYRREGARARMLEAEAREQEQREAVADDADAERVICACFEDLLPTLKPEYAEILRKVDLGGRAVTDVASELHITANNAGVRLSRARQALRRRLEATCRTCATHGCLDCSCGSAGGGHANS